MSNTLPKDLLLHKHEYLLQCKKLRFPSNKLSSYTYKSSYLQKLFVSVFIGFKRHQCCCIHMCDSFVS